MLMDTSIATCLRKELCMMRSILMEHLLRKSFRLLSGSVIPCVLFDFVSQFDYQLQCFCGSLAVVLLFTFRELSVRYQARVGTGPVISFRTVYPTLVHSRTCPYLMDIPGYLFRQFQKPVRQLHVTQICR